MQDVLLFLCIIFPICTGAVAFFDKGNIFQRKLVFSTGAILTIAALFLSFCTTTTVPFSSTLASAMERPILLLDFLLLAFIFFIGFKRKHPLIMGLALLQVIGMLYLELHFDHQMKPESPAFVIDSLSVTLVLIVSFVGSIIALYAIPYMKEHEEHLKTTETHRPRFFAIILLFLGAMNGLALADNLSWIYFFWEVTTLCSYLLINHDQTKASQESALRALWMNMAGGVAFVFALLYLKQTVGTLSLMEITALQQAGAMKPLMVMLPMVALCFAGFTKSAQAPFQSWLCGAMVAPTPVSALLHSSTMVKAGVYLILRLAPIYAGTSVSTIVAVLGAFTFIATAALAAGQSNAKKILAYSTISNLGLIIACAGINTAASLAAGMMLLIFHALSKALLFMAVGTIEQKIGSRDIEDMRGLFKVMPRTALITVAGILSMMLPPFGVLLAKWMALESAVEAEAAMPVIVAMLALGSGLTVLFWARWAGILLVTATPHIRIPYEVQDSDTRKTLTLLCGATLILSFFAPVIYSWLVQPAVMSTALAASPLLYTKTTGGIGNSYGVFAVYPIYLLISIGFWYAWRESKKKAPSTPSMPYMSGLQARENGQDGFIGPMKTFVAPTASNYYLNALFSEEKITKTINTVALVLLAMLLGGVLK